MILNPQLLPKIFECIIVKLLSIIKDDDPRDFEVANDAPPDEASNIFLYDSGQWFCLNPFGEVVDPHDENLSCHTAMGKGLTMSNPHWARI